MKKIITSFIFSFCYYGISQAQFFNCYSNQFQLEINSTKDTIFTCDNTFQLTTTSTNNPTVRWSDGTVGSSTNVYWSGYYYAYAYDSVGCVDTTKAIYVVLNNNYIQAYSGDNQNPYKICSGSYGTLSVYANGQATWNTGETSSYLTVTKAGKYFATMKSDNGCLDTSEIFEVKLITPDSLKIEITSGDSIFCKGDSAIISIVKPKSGSYYAWSPYYWESGSKSVVKVSGAYQVTTKDSATGCASMSNVINVNVKQPVLVNLCMVTIDSATGKNKLIWNHNSKNGIVSYNLFRESAVLGKYTLFGSVSNTNEFIDSFVNPKQRPYSYYLAAVDSCGNSAEESMYYIQTTLHLSANLGVSGENNLNWTNYGGSFPTNSYVIYRSNKGGKFVAIDSVSLSVNAYSDLTPPSGTNQYYIMVKGDGSYVCDTQSTQSLSIVSNFVAFGVLSSDNIEYSDLTVYPVPAKDELTILTSNILPKTAQISDVTGKVLAQVDVNQWNKTINIGNLVSGVYLLQLDGFKTLKFIKE